MVGDPGGTKGRPWKRTLSWGRGWQAHFTSLTLCHQSMHTWCIPWTRKQQSCPTNLGGVGYYWLAKISFIHWRFLSSLQVCRKWMEARSTGADDLPTMARIQPWWKPQIDDEACQEKSKTEVCSHIDRLFSSQETQMRWCSPFSLVGSNCYDLPLLGLSQIYCTITFLFTRLHLSTHLMLSLMFTLSHVLVQRLHPSALLLT